MEGGDLFHGICRQRPSFLSGQHGSTPFSPLAACHCRLQVAKPKPAPKQKQPAQATKKKNSGGSRKVRAGGLEWMGLRLAGGLLLLILLLGSQQPLAKIHAPAASLAAAAGRRRRAQGQRQAQLLGGEQARRRWKGQHGGGWWALGLSAAAVLGSAMLCWMTGQRSWENPACKLVTCLRDESSMTNHCLPLVLCLRLACRRTPSSSP